MPFTRLFAFMAAAGIIPILVGSLFDAGVLAFVCYNALLLVLLTVDYRITPGIRFLTAERVCDEKFSLAAKNVVSIKIRNNSNYALRLELKDQLPPHFQTVKDTVLMLALPHAESTGSYETLPEKRGEYLLGDVFVRYEGVMRLCAKKGKFQLQRAYKVYPNLRDLKKYSLAAISKLKMADGMKRSRTYGIGTEFESLKEYTEGEDYRKINWSATAREGRPIVNSYETERNQNVYILMDTSRVMNSEINHIRKLDYAVNTAFVLTDLVLKKGDSAGLLVFDSEVRRFVKPGKGEAQFRWMADSLYNIEERLVTADYTGALLHLNRQQKRRSLLCIFTELFSEEEAWMLVEALKSVARQHVPMLITIEDPRVKEIAQDSLESAEMLFKKTAAMKLMERRRRINGIFRRAGILCLDIPPDRLSIETLNQYLTIKSRMGI